MRVDAGIFALNPTANAPAIAMYRGRSKLSRLIRWWTRGPYSHAAIVTTAGTVIEAWTKGVREVASVSTDHAPGTQVDLFAVEGLTPERAKVMEDFARAQIHKAYDYRGLFGFLTRSTHDNEKAWFCSELAVAALRYGGLRPFSDMAPAWKVSPTVLAWSPGLQYVRSVVTVKV